MSGLEDRFQRRFSYLRLSITDACNYRCTYCLPNGYTRPAGQPEPLSADEIARLARGFARLGVWKIRVTGGEPTVRRDLVPILARLRETEGVRKLALSTNGHRLRSLAPALRAVGLDAVNVSVDSLDAPTFHRITGRDELPEVLAGIDAALEAGLASVKVNAVLMKGATEESATAELERFFDYTRTRPVAVRFIELMPTGGNQELFRSQHLRAEFIRARLARDGWLPVNRAADAGPAEEYQHPDFRGRIGVIAPYSRDFCASCNRLRVTAQGGLRLCLFGEKDLSLREYLQSDDRPSQDGLIAAVRTGLTRKEVSHFLEQDNYGNNSTFSAMGG
jgi:cyclic pyranopterin phosphate synthase